MKPKQLVTFDSKSYTKEIKKFLWECRLRFFICSRSSSSFLGSSGRGREIAQHGGEGSVNGNVYACGKFKGQLVMLKESVFLFSKSIFLTSSSAEVFLFSAISFSRDSINLHPFLMKYATAFGTRFESRGRFKNRKQFETKLHHHRQSSLNSRLRMKNCRNYISS